MMRFPVKLIVSSLFILMLMAGCSSDEAKIKKYLSNAQTFYDNQEYSKALIELKNVTSLDNSSAAAYTLMAEAYLKTQKPREMFNAYLRLEQIEPDNLEHKLKIASFMVLSKDFPQARRRVDEVLAKEPENIQALFLHAGILSAQTKDLDQVEAVYQKILSIDPNQARAYHVLAKIYNARKNFKKEESSLKKAIQIEPDNIAFYRSLFGYYMSQKKVDNARQVLENLAAQKPDEPQPLILLANFYLGTREADKAQELYEKALEVDPRHIDTYMLLAALMKNQGNLERAESLIQKALTIEPDNFALKNAQADFFFSTRDFDKAQALVDEILKDRPDYAPSKLLKGKILATQRQYDQAIEIFSRLLGDEPDSPSLNFLMGSAYFEKNENAKARPYLAKTLEKQPGHLGARFMMATIYFRGNDVGLAEDAVKKVLRQAPEHYNANVLLGNIELSRKNYDLAEDIFKKLIQAVPDNPVAYYRLALTDMANRRTDHALTMFSKALELNPNLMDVFTAMIGAYASEKKFGEALKKCDEHLAKTQGSPTQDNPSQGSPIVQSVIYNLKGNLYLATGKTKNAQQAFEKAISANPKYVIPYQTLARMAREAGDTDKAIELYKTLIENRSDQAFPHCELGVLYENKNEVDAARQYYEKALEINPDYLPAMNNLAYLLAEHDQDLNKALDLARRAKEKLGRVPAVMDTLGWVYYKKELYDSALQEFETCVEKEPENPVFHYHMGLAHYRLGSYNQAETALKKALSLKNDFAGADEAQKILDQL